MNTRTFQIKRISPGGFRSHASYNLALTPDVTSGLENATPFCFTLPPLSRIGSDRYHAIKHQTMMVRLICDLTNYFRCKEKKLQFSYELTESIDVSSIFYRIDSGPQIRSRIGPKRKVFQRQYRRLAYHVDSNELRRKNNNVRVNGIVALLGGGLEKIGKNLWKICKCPCNRMDVVVKPQCEEEYFFRKFDNRRYKKYKASNPPDALNLVQGVRGYLRSHLKPFRAPLLEAVDNHKDFEVFLRENKGFPRRFITALRAIYGDRCARERLAHHLRLTPQGAMTSKPKFNDESQWLFDIEATLLHFGVPSINLDSGTLFPEWAKREAARLKQRSDPVVIQRLRLFQAAGLRYAANKERKLSTLMGRVKDSSATLDLPQVGEGYFATIIHAFKHLPGQYKAVVDIIRLVTQLMKNVTWFSECFPVGIMIDILVFITTSEMSTRLASLAKIMLHYGSVAMFQPLVDLFFSLELKVKPQGTTDDVFDVLNLVKNSTTSVKAVTLLSAFFGTSLFNSFPEGVKMALNAFRETAFHVATELSFVDKLLEFMKYITERVAATLETGDIKELFGTSAVISFIENVSEVSADIIKIQSGGNFTKHSLEQISLRIAKLVDREKNLKSIVATDAIRALVGQFASFESSFENKRCEPLGIIAVGDSGMGKSSIVEDIENAMRAHLKLPEYSITHTYNEGFKHQPLPAVVTILAFNDFFSTKDEHCAEATLTLLQRAVDTQPLRFEGASIEEKKRPGIAPWLVWVSTNASGYKMSQSVSGASKLTRRYRMLVCEFTQKAKDEALKGGYDVATTFTEHHDFRTSKGFVHYRIGEMAEPDKNTVSFKIGKVEAEFDDYQTLLRYIVKHIIAKREKGLLSRICLKSVCPFGFPLPHTTDCECLVKEPQGSAYSAPIAFDEEAFGLMDDEEACAYVDQHRAKVNREALVRMGWNWTLDTMLVSFMISLPIIFGIVIGMRTNPQGSVLSLANVEATKSEVRVFTSSHVPFITPPDKGFEGLVASRSAFKMHFLLLCHNLICLPLHFFEGISGKVGHLKKGDEFTLIVNGIVNYFIYEEHRLLKDQLGDGCYYLIDSLAGNVTPIFSKIGDIGGPLTFKGMEYERKQGYPGFICHGCETTVAGDCGLPVFSGGTIAGFHNSQGTSLYVGTIAMCHPLSKVRVAEVCAHFRLLGLMSAIPAAGCDAINVLIEKQVLLPGVHPRSDYAWYIKDKDEESVTKMHHGVVGHLASFDSMKMSGRETEMFQVFADLGKAYKSPHPGKARCIDGTYVSGVTNRLKVPGEAIRKRNDLLSRAVDYIVAELAPKIGKMEPLTLTQCVCGDDRNRMMNPRDNEKSIGYTWRLRGFTKNGLFKHLGDGKYFIHPELIKDFEMKDQTLRRGEMILNVAMATPKDELLPAEKVDKGKVRLFYVCDLTFNLLLRRYVLPILAFIMEHPWQSGVFGILNPTSLQWAALAQHLTEFGAKTNFDADQSEYDLRHLDGLRRAGDVMYRIAVMAGYNSEDLAATAAVISSCFFYVLLMEGNFFFCDKGLCSGLAVTLGINSLASKVAIYYAFLCHDDKLSPSENLRVANVGDDNVTGVNPLSGFNGTKCALYQKDLGYLVTNASKGADLPFVDISQITFLKRGFVFRDGLWRAPIDVNSIYRSLKYRTGTSDERERSLGVLCAAAREFAEHGEDAYNQFLGRVRRLPFSSRIPTFETLELDRKMGCSYVWETHHGSDYHQIEPTIESVVKEILVERQGAFEQLNIDLRDQHKYGQICEPRVGLFSISASPTSREVPVVELPALFYHASINPTSEVATSEISGNAVTQFNVVSGDKMKLDESNVIMDSSVPDAAVAKYLERPRKILTYSYDVASTFSGASVGGALYAMSPMLSFVQQWQFMRTGFRVTINYTGATNQTGLVRIWFTPQVEKTENGSIAIDNSALLLSYNHTTDQYPHMDLNMSVSCTCTIDLPYTGVNPYRPVDSPGWYLHVSPLVPLEKNDGLTPAPILITAYAGYLNTSFLNLVRQGEYSGPVSSLLQYTSRLAGYIPHSFVQGISKALAGASDMANFLGYSKPLAVVEGAMYQRGSTNMAFMGGESDMSQSITSHPGVSSNVNPMQFPLGKPGDTNIKTLVSEWSQLGAVSILDTKTYMATPFQRNVGGNHSTFTRLAFFQGLFEMYSGSIDFKVDFIVSPLTRVRFGVAVTPPGQSVPLTFSENGTVQTYIVEVAGPTTFEFTVPWMYAEAARRRTGGVFLNTAAPSGLDVPFVTFFQLGEATGTVNSIRGLVSIRAGKDYSYGVPTLSNFAGLTINPQGQVEELTGEVVEDLVYLSRRPTLTGAFDTAPIGNIVELPVALFVRPASTVNPIAIYRCKSDNSFYHLCAASFIGCNGGTRLKIRPVLGTASMKFKVTRGYGPYAILGPTGLKYYGTGDAVMTMDQGNMFEFSIPYVSNTKFLNPRCVGSIAGDPVSVIQTFNVEVYGPTVTVENNVWIAGADDYTFGGFIGTPVMFDVII